MIPKDSDKSVILAAELEEAQAQIRRLNQEIEGYRGLVENVRDMIWRTNPRGEVIFVTPICEEFLGVTSAQLLGRCAADFLSPDSVLNVEKGVRETLLASPPSSFFETEVAYHHRDGRLIHAELRMSAERDAIGRVLAFCGVSRDISGRQKMQQELRTSLRQLDTVLSCSYSGVLLVSDSGIVELPNQAEVPFEQEGILKVPVGCSSSSRGGFSVSIRSANASSASVNSTRRSPTTISSSIAILVGVRPIREPLTKVPLVLPRSSISRISPTLRSTACRRDTEGSSTDRVQ